MANEIMINNENDLRSKIYTIRGLKVMLDFDLAEIYGYETKMFNRQVKNNIERFDNDFRFQLTQEEFDGINLRCNFCTSSSERINQDSQGWGGKRYLPYAFTEQGIKRTLSEKMVTKDDLSRVIKDFTDPKIKRDYLFFNGETVEADIAYSTIYSSAKKSVYVVDNYISLKTLVLLKSVKSHVHVIIFSDNVGKTLHKTEFSDFQKEYQNIHIALRITNGIYHDRYIFVDYGTKTEKIYHCGGSSKDGGSRIMSISQVEDTAVYQKIAADLLKNPALVL